MSGLKEDIKIYIHRTVGNTQYKDEDAVVIGKDNIISLNFSEGNTEMVSPCTILLPNLVAAAFMDYPCYKVVFIKLNEEVIYIGRVVQVDSGVIGSVQAASVQLASMTADLQYATGDYQKYPKMKTEDLLFRQIELILRDAPNGSPVSPLVKSDYIFFSTPKHNQIQEQIVRQAGAGIASMIQQLLSLGSLFMWTQMYNERSKVIVSHEPLIPAGRGGFSSNANRHINSKGEMGSITISIDKYGRHTSNINNIDSFAFSYDASLYRDRLRILCQNDNNNGEFWELNPFLKAMWESGNIPLYQTNKKGIKLYKVPFVPHVIHREYLSKKEAQQASAIIWNKNANYAPEFTLALASWQLEGVRPKVGTELNLSFSQEFEAQNKTEVRTVYENVPVVISKTEFSASVAHGLVCHMTLTDKNSFGTEYPLKRRSATEAKPLSYYTGFSK